MERYKRKESEDTIPYLLRLAEIKIEEKPDDLDWSDIAEYCNFDCHYDSLRKALQPKEYGGLAIYKYLKDKIVIENVSDDKVLDEYEQKKIELQKERIKVQTEKINLNQLIRQESRYELFIEKAIDAINNISPILSPNIKIKNNDNFNREGILIFSDPHYGKDLIIKGLKGEILNTYTPEIFEKRMWQLLNETILICKKENFTSIKIMSLGDELEGMIRIGQLMNLRYGVVESAIKYSYFIANWLNELSKYIKIDYYSTHGNHTDLRLLDNKKGTFPHENISKIIDVLISEITKDNINITINKNEIEKIFIDVQGFNILGIHGEEKDVNNSIRDFSFIYNEKIDYIISGHKHHSNSSNLGMSKGSIGVGSIIGIDDYSIQLKRISDPSATFVVFEKEKGKTIEYSIKLD